MTRTMTVVIMLTVLTGSLYGGTLPASISREPLMKGTVSGRVSVGVNYSEIERGVKIRQMPDAVLEAKEISVYLGYDLLPWLTGFVTVGGTELKGEADIGSDAGLKLSGGISAYLWEGDLLEPAFMTGRFSIKAMASLSHQESDTDAGTVKWMDVMAALPIGYERFDRYPAGSSGLSTSLALYAGPAVSYWRGSAGTPFGSLNFTAEEALGLVAGLDVFFAPSLSVGVKVLVFDELSYGASLRFHF